MQVVLPRSHLLYPQLVEELGTLRTRDDGSQRLSLPEEYEQMLAEQRPEMFEGAIVAHLEPGDLFLWCVALPLPSSSFRIVVGPNLSRLRLQG